MPSALTMEMRIEQFLSRVEVVNECWHWKGRFRLDGSPMICNNPAARFAYMVWIDAVPDTHLVKPKCGVNSCVNPDHLISIHRGGIEVVESVGLHPAVIKKFWRHVVKSELCWTWSGPRMNGMYGVFNLPAQLRVDGQKKTLLAHRISHEIVHGPIPPGMHVDHLCRNPGCVRPDHLEVVTPSENLKRGNNGLAARTHCRQGHEMSGYNLMLSKTGKRGCRTCRKHNVHLGRINNGTISNPRTLLRGMMKNEK